MARQHFNDLVRDPPGCYRDVTGIVTAIKEWGARVGASNRTLVRLFQRETGMSFVGDSSCTLDWLCRGWRRANSSRRSPATWGYESVSAFILMFRRMLGTTPTRYFDNAGLTGLATVETKAMGANRRDDELVANNVFRLK